MKNKKFLKKADTTEFDQYTCSNCSKFGTRWCPFVGTENEPTAETRACMHFDKSYTVLVDNTDYKEISTITQEENLYKHYQKPEKVDTEEDNNEPYSHACGECTKFGTIMCPYLETNSKNRACQAFSIKTPEGEDEIKIQDFDYDALTYDIPRENYHIHPKTNTLKDMVEHPFAFKTVYPQPYRVADDKTKKVEGQNAQYQYGLTEDQENALNTYLLDYRSLKGSGLVNITLANVDNFEQNLKVNVEGVLTQFPNVSFFYRMTKEGAPDRYLVLMNNDTDENLATEILGPGDKVIAKIQQIINQLKRTGSVKKK